MGELKGIYGGTFGFRVDIKAHPDGGWLLMTDGYAAGDDRYDAGDWDGDGVLMANFSCTQLHDFQKA